MPINYPTYLTVPVYSPPTLHPVATARAPAPTGVVGTTSLVKSLLASASQLQLSLRQDRSRMVCGDLQRRTVHRPVSQLFKNTDVRSALSHVKWVGTYD